MDSILKSLCLYPYKGKKMTSEPKHILITGALGGLGTATITQLTKNQWYVFAADVNSNILEKYKDNDWVTPVLMDITDQSSIDKAFDKIAEQTSGLDAVINLAGILIVGSMVELPIESVSKIIDVNLLGAYRLNQKFLPLILSKKGRIINISSETGWQTAAPFNGAYALSKYALEAYSDALRRELAFLNIKVIKIQPGPFKTEMTKHIEQKFAKAENESTLFKKNLAKGQTYLPNVYKNAHDPVILAKTIVRALTAKKPKAAYSLKPDKIRSILEIIPTRWADYLVKKALS